MCVRHFDGFFIFETHELLRKEEIKKSLVINDSEITKSCITTAQNMYTRSIFFNIILKATSYMYK